MELISVCDLVSHTGYSQ